MTALHDSLSPRSPFELTVYKNRVARILEIKTILRTLRDQFNQAEKDKNLSEKARLKVQYTELHNEYEQHMAEIEADAERIAGGQTTGDSILDRIVLAKQIHTDERIEGFRAIEQKLQGNVDQPILFQDWYKWHVAVLCEEQVYFSGTNYRSFFGTMAEGSQSLPVYNYVEMDIDPFVSSEQKWGRRNFALTNRGPLDLPEAGNQIGLPISGSTIRYPSPIHDLPIPDGLQAAWNEYDKHQGYVFNEYGARRQNPVLHVGQADVESNLGMSLEELLTYQGDDPNLPLLEVATR